MVPGKKYTFNVINLEKTNSQYNFGMQPCMYSNAAREQNGKGWHRVGKNICYMKNTHKRTRFRKYIYIYICIYIYMCIYI